MALTSIRHKPIYFLPRDDLITEVLIPSFENARLVQCMMGFFTSEAFRELAPGLATYLQGGESPLQLIISPNLSADDREALENGVKNRRETLTNAFTSLVAEAEVSEYALVHHTLDCISYLIASEQLDIRLSFVIGATFHPKVWLFSDNVYTIAVHGSSNMTLSGLTRNYEQISVNVDWQDSDEPTVRSLKEEFKLLWTGEQDNTQTISLEDTVKHQLLNSYSVSSPPSHDDFLTAWEKDYKQGHIHTSPPVEDSNGSSNIKRKKGFHIPESLVYESGPYAHQGEAVSAWLEAGSNGILEMATGSGKTIAALIAAEKVFAESSSLLITIAVPTRPLINQWCDEAKEFGLTPHSLGDIRDRTKRFKKIDRVLRSMEFGRRDVECLIVTHDFLCDKDFQDILSSFSTSKLLIGDEVHNLGREEFISNPPDSFDFRLGLSATPVREYDDRGTNALMEYFGDIVFRFTLQDAIGTCLTPYTYHVHPIYLTTEEVDEWIQLSQAIRNTNWDPDTDDPPKYVKKLLRRRRLILETADSKLSELEDILGSKSAPLRHTLIYGSDKEPHQLSGIHDILNKYDVLFHQITQEETQNSNDLEKILRSFSSGDLQVLTAKRVLDEGIDIPQIQSAYLLASTTVERQWIQRRGRLLRKCDSIGKAQADIHDFITIPPEASSEAGKDIQRLVKAELDRVNAFAQLAANAAVNNGPLMTIQPLYREFFAKGA